MSFTISAKLDIPAALRAGSPINVDCDQCVQITVPDDLEPTDRELLATYLHGNGIGQFDVRSPTGYRIHILKPTIAGVLEALRAYRADEVARADKAKADKAAKDAKLIQTIKERKETIRVNTYLGVEWRERCTGLWDGEVKHLPEEIRREWDAWQEDMNTANRLAQAAANAQSERDRAAKQAKLAEEKAAEDAVIAAWVNEHGSSHLRKLLKGGYELGKVYRNERLAKERPGWRWEHNQEEGEDPSNPPEIALDLIEQLKLTAPDAKLVYLKQWREAEYGEQDDADEDGDIVTYCYCGQAKFMGRSIISLDVVGAKGFWR